MAEDPRLEGALAFARRGWPVFPVGQNKLPAVKKWEQKATTDEARIRDWFESVALGGCNFGFPPGRAGIVVVDTDRGKVRKGVTVDGEDSLREYLLDSAEGLPGTFRVRTPSGGAHRYYAASGLKSRNGLFPAVDVKAGGGYVIIPGSRTEKGSYVIEDPAEPAPAPAWLAAALERRTPGADSPAAVTYNARITPDSAEKVARAEQIIADWPKVEEGERNNQLFMLMRELCKAGISRGLAAELYASEALGKIGLDPAEREVRATMDSAYRAGGFGAESKEARDQAVLLLDPLPDPPEEPRAKFSDRGGADWAELAAAEVPPRRWFIQDWLAADEGYTVLFSGRGGTGKSCLALDLMHSLATGEPFAGQAVLRRGRTMLVSCEDSEEELARRIHRRSRLDQRPVPPGVARVWCRLGHDNILCAPDRRGILREAPFMAELRARGREHFGTEGGVLILDTLADMYAGNENDRSQVSQFVKHHLNKLGAELGVAIVVLAHPSKLPSATGQGFSGSTAWEGAFRCRWELNYVKADRVDGLVELVLAKSNVARPGRRIVLDNSGGVFTVVDSAAADETVRGAVAALIDEAYRAGNPFTRRNGGGGRPIESARVLDPVSGEPVDEKTIRRLVDELVAEGAVVRFRDKNRRGLKLA